MKPIERFYPESRFGGFSDVDGTVIFFSRVNALLRPDMTVLDVGCGRGAGLVDDPIPFRRGLRRLRGKCRTVIGIDLDPEAARNPGIDEFRLMDAKTGWPVADRSIDLLISDFVLEHVTDPGSYFIETGRVLRSGGIFCARTANRLSYVGLLARLIPQSQHAKILRAAQKDRSDVDIFPTHYRVNTVRQVRRMLKKVGLNGIAYGYEAEPAYLQFSAAIYAVGKFLHNVTPSPFRTSLFIFARKQL